MKTVLITDVHGCLGELKLLLRAVELDEKEDKLIFLGDMLDRGFHSYGTYLEFLRLKEAMGDRFILCRGNHDQLVLLPDVGFVDKVKWLVSGRILSDLSFALHHSHLRETIPFLEKHTVLYHEEPEFLCVHAAVVDEDLSKNTTHTLLFDHFQTRRNQYQGKLALTGHIHERYPKYYDGHGGKGIRLAYGEWQELPEKGIICIDTGCAEFNRLTAMVVKDGAFLLKSVRRGGR